MEEEVVVDAHKKVLADELRKRGIKLWLPPYTKEDNSKGDIPEDILAELCRATSFGRDRIVVLLESLRLHAINKLSERNEYQKSGTAFLKVKVTGLKDDKQAPVKKSISVETRLDVACQVLKEKISSMLGFPTNQLKLISAGHVLSNDLLLCNQNEQQSADGPVSDGGAEAPVIYLNNSQLMALCLTVGQAEAQRQQEDVRHMVDARKAAELLSQRAHDDDAFVDVQIADQTGKPLKLPPEERKALTLAMALHEKGRVSMKKKEETRAMLLLLEADKEFSKCSAEILNAVDNYGVLCLDIVWCYLCLKAIEELPDAGIRLQKSEECFSRTYGSNLERLQAVKGATGQEEALFMRLHLLKAIVAFHQNQLDKAERYLTQADTIYTKLNVDEELLTQVMQLGFNEREARLGLRGSGGNIEEAVQLILRRREEKEEITKKVKEDRRKRKLEKSLGRTADGQSVNVDIYEMLLQMGFKKGAAAEALRQANNSLDLALQVLQSHPELLDLPDPNPAKVVKITDEMIAQVVNIGFEESMAKAALHKHKGNMEAAVMDLTQNDGIVEYDHAAEESSGSSNDTENSDKHSKDQKEEEEKAIKALISDLPEDEEEYLDLDLQAEGHFLQMYKSLLSTMRT